MSPGSSSVRPRRRQGGGEIPTRLASSTLVIRPSAWISLRILRSISSRFFDTGLSLPGTLLAPATSRQHSVAQSRPLAQFYCACTAQSPCREGKIRSLGLQLLHSSPHNLDLDLTLSAPPRCLSGLSPLKALTSPRPKPQETLSPCPRLSMPRSSSSDPARPAILRRSTRRAPCWNRF